MKKILIGAGILTALIIPVIVFAKKHTKKADPVKPKPPSPPKPDPITPDQPDPLNPTGTPKQGFYYHLKKGDILSRVANRAGLSSWRLIINDAKNAWCKSIIHPTILPRVDAPFWNVQIYKKSGGHNYAVIYIPRDIAK